MLGRNLEASVDALRRTDATAELADRVATLSASAAGADGAVRVTVGGSGIVTGLQLADSELAAEIMRIMRRAQARLTEQVAAAVDETVGADTETGKAVLESFTQRFQPEPVPPVMPAPPPFPTFQNKPSLPHQAPGGGFESGRDSRAR